MPDYTDQKYDAIGAWVSQKINDGYTWDDVRLLCVSADQFADKFDELQNGEMIIPPDMRSEQWAEFVEVHRQRFSFIETAAGFSANGPVNALPIPQGASSSWVKYRNYLRGVETGHPKVSKEGIENITKHSLFVMNQLRHDTRDIEPVKGLVMGSVQSGKTANMAGLLSMAADNDWNFFVVLSGTIDNLRKQTRDRFAKDLKSTQDVDWHFLDYVGCRNGALRDLADPGRNPLYVDDLELNLMSGGTLKHPARYVIVCLKQASRLRYLLDWIYNSPQGRASRLRIVIIDDEADQASVNTARMDGETDEEFINRTRVNQLICNLANGRDSEGNTPNVKCNGINFVSYTATPYANVLNEAGRASLYPSDFVYALSEPREYFGGRVIFGSKLEPEAYPGLDGIIHDVPHEEVHQFSDLQSLIHERKYIPDELKNSILWFLCAAAALRTVKWRKPISMLIHTTAQTTPHFDTFSAVRGWFDNVGIEAIVAAARSYYPIEKARFTKHDLISGFASYACLEDVPEELPDFDAIESEVRCILREVRPILLDAEGDLTYLDNAIHLCVDNCQARQRSEGDEYLRIVYPTDEQLENDLTKAPVFIVIGGNTLSRGLTIEGLVCTYFTRGSNQADSLMQMGRWFGYRKGYELLQRIWMPEDIQDRFELLAEINEKLLAEVHRFEVDPNLKPSQFGPKVLNASQIARFRISARNKTQNAEEVGFDFTGDSFETTKFDQDETVFRRNIEIVDRFAGWLGEPVDSETSDHAYLWRGVEYDQVRARLLDPFIMSDAVHQRRDFQWLKSWIEEQTAAGDFEHWNVAVAGNANARADWFVGGKNPGKIERTKLKGRTHIDIHSLRSGLDAMCDVELSRLNEQQQELFMQVRRTKRGINAARSQLGLEDTPLLLIYRIDRAGGVEKQTRARLNTENDIVGFSIIIPGELVGTVRARYLQVRIPA